MSDLPELVRAMLNPKFYPENPPAVELVQTQMSFVFLTDEYVYKVKKPVDLGYLDYTTLEKRRHFCEQEVRLNRRLCPNTYLGVAAITRDQGDYRIDGEGEAVEYAVRMRRLPQAAMMDVMLAENEVSAEMVTRVARKLAEFHRRAETGATISAFGNLDTITRNTTENFTQTERYIGHTLSPETYARLKDYTDRFTEQNEALFQSRVAEGRIRDCHGDLHAAHICFSEDICIYDCIEFNDRFRYCDVASEIAFLAMDLDHYGRADLARIFVNSYVEHSQDKGLRAMLKFYKGYRAYVRGKVESFKLDDPYIAGEAKGPIRKAAAGYFDLAAAYTWPRPVLFITTGLVGTGKSALSQGLARRFGLTVISSDMTRKNLAGIPPTEHRFDEFDAGIYSAGFTRMTYDRMFAQAKEILGEGSPVILDASFIKAEERLRAKELAQRAGAAFRLLECTLDDATIKERLARRRAGGSISDGRLEILGPQKKEFEPVVAVNPREHVIIDTSQPIDRLADEVGARMATLFP